MFIFLLIPSILNRIIQSQYLIIEMLWLTLAHFHIFYFHNQSGAWCRALITDSYVQSKLCWGDTQPTKSINIQPLLFISNLDSLLILFKQKYWRSADSIEYGYTVESSVNTEQKSISTLGFSQSQPVLVPLLLWSLQGCNYLE